MSKLKVLLSAFVLAVGLAAMLPSCGGDCAKASDCAADEVCYQEICQPALSPFFGKGCQVDNDCNGNGDNANNLRCELGRCRVINTAPVIVPDSGVTDTGTTTGADS